MSRSRRRVLAVLWLYLSSSLAACGDDDSPPLIAPDSATPTPTPPAPPSADASADAARMDAGGDDASTPPPPPPTDMGAPMDLGPADATTTPMDASAPDAGPMDLDGDGLDDGAELDWAIDYLPFLSVDPADACPLGTLLFRARPHPDDAGLVLIEYVALFERDCGALGHVGDNEGFSVTADPTIPGPEGILALRAISHRGTACHSETTCGRSTCGSGISECAYGNRRGVRYPVVFFSTGKHGGYTSEMSCDGACVLTNYCTLATTPYEPGLLNVGEPEAPLVSNLTVAGAITAANGWTEMDLFDYDPWGPEDFGGAGNVAGQLMDPDFVTPACR